MLVATMTRAALALPMVLLAAAPAHADRHGYLTLGVLGDGRATGRTWDDAGKTDVSPWGGGRLTLSFEDAPIEMPPPTFIATDTRLVPELAVGFVANDIKAEGMLSAGLRGELHLASHRRGFQMRTVMYAAARADVIGKHQDGAAEFALGEYLLIGDSTTRFGWEGGAMIRPQPHAGAAHAKELDALMSIYLGWPL